MGSSSKAGSVERKASVLGVATWGGAGQMRTGVVAPVEGPLGWCRLAASGLPRRGQKNEAIPLAAVFASNISPTAVGCPTISTPL